MEGFFGRRTHVSPSSPERGSRTVGGDLGELESCHLFVELHPAILRPPVAPGLDAPGSLLDVLAERGFVQQCSNEEGLRALLDSQRVTYYIGFDPTARSLHVGHLVQLFAMAHLQRSGHRPIALIGGGTCRIGDPSGKTEMRKILAIQTINANAERFRAQISRFLDFSDGRGLMLNNADWLMDINYVEFLRDQAAVERQHVDFRPGNQRRKRIKIEADARHPQQRRSESLHCPVLG